jgi:hypothetical protein
MIIKVPGRSAIQQHKPDEVGLAVRVFTSLRDFLQELSALFCVIEIGQDKQKNRENGTGEIIMCSDVNRGIVAGLVGGIVFGIMMQMMNAPTPDGGQMPMMAMVAKVVRSESTVVGWLYHLFNSAVIGGIFGWLFGRRSKGFAAGLGWGAAYGFIWWILGGLILMPVLLGMSSFAPLQMEPMRPVAMGSMMGHLIYGIILGGGFVMLKRGVPGLTRHA